MSKQEIIKVIPTIVRPFEKVEGYSLKRDAWLHNELEEKYIFDHQIQQLIDKLVSIDLPQVGNFYADSELTRLNLKKYFNALFWAQPECMLIGEAPGIHGCVKTGIPFTSERLIFEDALSFHFPNTRFVVEGKKAEASATVIWREVQRLEKPPIMWNAFPLHPMDLNGNNRTPRAAELEKGREILSTILELFPKVKIVSVGRKAEEACYKLGISTEGHVFHPARHANQFRKQFADLFFKQS